MRLGVKTERKLEKSLQDFKTSIDKIKYIELTDELFGEGIYALKVVFKTKVSYYYFRRNQTLKVMYITCCNTTKKRMMPNKKYYYMGKYEGQKIWFREETFKKYMQSAEV